MWGLTNNFCKQYGSLNQASATQELSIIPQLLQLVFLSILLVQSRLQVLKEASRLYAASWVRDIGPDLRPNDYKKNDGTEGKSNGEIAYCPTLSVYSIECVFRILRILLMDSSIKISFNRCIRDGDLIIVYERRDTMKAVKVCENSVLQNRFCVFKHSDWIGKPFGSIIFSNRGGFIYLLALTPEFWTLVLSHMTQILYIADISFVIMYLEVVPGCLVLESGTGSGSSGTCVYL
ncbi:hypothetical protein ES332_D10G000200v1 [Gossypium tomentosum]|uniref:tRNA (adenine(58)-N(1))-methyltransferase n=1 Tax=Gossypium tomentosum TaxID=34277 RepID=A0A5D2IYG8_GOSTO|nr:hypothetical protein ES332_D10G000200v1 [Gossypium tomentosum]